MLNKLMELLGEMEKQSVQFRRPILAHAIGGGVLGATAGVALPLGVHERVTKKDPDAKLKLRIARTIGMGLIGASFGGLLKQRMNETRYDRLINMARRSDKIIQFNGRPVRVLDTKHYNPILAHKLIKRTHGIL